MSTEDFRGQHALDRATVGRAWALGQTGTHGAPWHPTGAALERCELHPGRRHNHPCYCLSARTLGALRVLDAIAEGEHLGGELEALPCQHCGAGLAALGVLAATSSGGARLVLECQRCGERTSIGTGGAQ